MKFPRMYPLDLIWYNCPLYPHSTTIFDDEKIPVLNLQLGDHRDQLVLHLTSAKVQNPIGYEVEMAKSGGFLCI
jgi:hypothetical protein